MSEIERLHVCSKPPNPPATHDVLRWTCPICGSAWRWQDLSWMKTVTYERYGFLNLRTRKITSMGLPGSWQPDHLVELWEKPGATS